MPYLDLLSVSVVDKTLLTQHQDLWPDVQKDLSEDNYPHYCVNYYTSCSSSSSQTPSILACRPLGVVCSCWSPIYNQRYYGSENKIHPHCCSHLAKITIEVRNLILRPPTKNLYNHLKSQLIKCTTASKQRRLQLLFNAEELGDCMPTQLVHWMQQLLGDKAVSTERSFLHELSCSVCPTITVWSSLPPQIATVMLWVSGLQHITDTDHKSVALLPQNDIYWISYLLFLVSSRTGRKTSSVHMVVLLNPGRLMIK